MCRLLGYIGSPVLMDQLLYQPHNSLIHQSYHALERKDPVNGDGFGVGWYVPEIDAIPGRYLSTRPAWNDQNLRSLASKTRSGSIFAHVRAASVGAVSEMNCHPFQYGSLLMMHNGDIGGFQHLKRRLVAELSDTAYSWISGQTDSEHFFALFLTHLLKQPKSAYAPQEIATALLLSIKRLKAIVGGEENPAHFYLNVVITDGSWMVASRYDTNPHVASPTLYYSSGSYVECLSGHCRMAPATAEKRSVLIVSEKLTEEAADWHKIPESHIVVVTRNLDVSVIPMDL